MISPLLCGENFRQMKHPILVNHHTYSSTAFTPKPFNKKDVHGRLFLYLKFAPNHPRAGSLRTTNIPTKTTPT
ncbi:hypothetical protein, partial [Pseudomonas sp. PA-5-4B]|uniref:hypothetical protein n=1 Tax=Pseudomonas sp. PA-5-4B TaxID=2665478 RepID=UPI001F45340B